MILGAFTWLIRNPKILIIGIVLIAFTGLGFAYSFQRTTLTKMKANLAEAEQEAIRANALVLSLRSNIDNIKERERKVEVIKYRDRIVKEIVTEKVPGDTVFVKVPIDATPTEKEVCKRYVEQEEKTNKQMVAVQNAAALITDFYNDKLRDDTTRDQIRAEILSKTSTVGTTASENNARPAP